jgi:heat shock protein HslJ
MLRFVTVWIAAALLAGCMVARKRPTLAATWQLLRISAEKPDTFFATRPELQFQKDGVVRANTGCNELQAEYSVEGDLIHFGGQQLTSNYVCPGFDEEQFVKMLARVNRYEISENELHFLRDTVLLMTFIPKG